MNTIDDIMRQLAEYNRIAEETNAIIDGLKDEIKAYMQARNTDTIIGKEHTATYKPVTATRFDSTAFKRDHADTYAMYARTTTNNRFTFK